jgi:crotonobetainyl-CoA:carnitine CoA-transferase CaiB-like acyl-CoA transferase
VPYQVFPTADGHMVLSVGNDPTFKRFCEAFALTHLLEDERFATNAARVSNRQLVTDTLTPVMQQHPTNWWIEQLETLKIGCGPINKLAEVFNDPHILARNMVLEMAHSSGQSVKVIANPVKLSETPADYRLPPPLLGEHTDAVLAERLGLDSAAIASLREKGVV